MSARTPGPVQVLPLTGLPEVTAGTDLAAELARALSTQAGGLRDGDLLVVSSKLVSKAAGLRHLPRTDTNTPGATPADSDAARLAAIRAQSTRVVAERLTPAGLTQVVEAVSGPVLAAAGVDASNTGPEGGFLLLPPDPDRAARELHAAVQGEQGTPPRRFGLVLSDTAGRPWREGQTDFALGAAGVTVLDDLRGGGHVDADGRRLAVTARAVGDEVAAAADLVKGKADGVGAALLRGLDHLVHGDGPGDPAGRDAPPAGAWSLTRTGPGDWFALGHREAVRSALGAPPGTPRAEQVGIPSVLPETDEDRGRRAVRLALLDHEGAVVEHAAPGVYAVRADGDPVLAGRVAARLEVAMAGEGLTLPVRVLSGPPPG